MKKNRNFNLKALLLLCLVIFSNCSKDEIIVEPIESEALIETVSIDDAKNLFKDSNSSMSLFSKSSEEPFLTPDLNNIEQENIDNSEELITVIPATTIDHNLDSRIVLLRIDGEIKSVVFNMYSDTESDDQSFTGKIFITELDGSFLYGYRVEQGKTVAKLLKGVSSEKSSKNESNLMGKSNYGGNNCPFSDPNLCQLNEVTITVTLPNNNNYGVDSRNTIYLANLFNSSYGYANSNYNYTNNYSRTTYSWNYGGFS